MKHLLVFVTVLLGAVVSLDAQQKKSEPKQAETRKDGPVVDQSNLLPLTPERITEAMKACREYLADNLKDPDSYKEGKWIVYPRKDRAGNHCIGIVHEFRAANSYGAVNQQVYVFDYSEGRKKELSATNVLNFKAGDMDVGALVYKNTLKEIALLKPEDVYIKETKKTLGGEEIK